LIKLNPILKFFKFFYDDFKGDILFIKRLVTEEGFFDARVNYIKDKFEQMKITDFLNAVWPVILIMAASMAVGWWLASRYYEGLCNQYIVDNCVKTISDYTKPLINYTLKMN